MSFSNDLSKAEVMGWSAQSLADYMRRLKFTNCDKVVMKGNISGAQFLQMTECDLQVFPILYISILAKIQSDLNKEEQKKAFLKKTKAPQYPKQVIVQQEELSNSDDYESGSDYEGPQQEEGEDSYTCTMNEPQTAEQQDSDKFSEEEGEQPPLPLRPRLPPKVSELPDNRDPVRVPTPAERPSKPPPPRPFRAADSKPSLDVDRSKKPGKPIPSPRDLNKSKGSTVVAPVSSTSKPLQPPRPPRPTDVPKRHTELLPPPPGPTQPAMVTSPTPRPRGCVQGLDPTWYKGNVTRHQAEAALRQMNQDGVFMVRDSSHGSDQHPYTLMLLRQGKIYNIKIRYQDNFYSLGTGKHHTKSFPGVKEMITHHTYTPLVLIDAADQSSDAYSQCCLLHPVGL